MQDAQNPKSNEIKTYPPSDIKNYRLSVKTFHSS